MSVTRTITATREFRASVRKLEIRAVEQVDDENPEEAGGFDVAGYAAVFNEPYEVWDWLGSYTEVIEPGAFTKTLNEKDDVRLLVNHDGLPLARTKSSTLTLSQDDVGLYMEARLDADDPDVAAVVPKMRRGDLDEMSFAFQVVQQQWSPDFEERHVKEVKLFDVSLVTFPANPATSAWMRMENLAAELDRLDDDVLRAGQRAGAGAELVERLTRRLDSLRSRPAPAAGGGDYPLRTALAQADALRLRRSA